MSEGDRQVLGRRVIAVEGTVQGVGFRPYVRRLAAARTLHGFVRNDTRGVLIDVEGDLGRIDEFCRALVDSPPPLASIERVRIEAASPQRYDAFRVVASETEAAAARPASVPPDAATCGACLADLRDPTSRRFEHPFVSCPDCGPRFTVVRSGPYDRARTSMAPFVPCPECQREYDDPGDRRFGAEAIACSHCGPALVARPSFAATQERERADPVARALDMLRAGGTVAVKALGGFHLACDATSEPAVLRLRQRKGRPHKPFAVMVRDVAAAEALGTLSAAERVALQSTACPIVLLQRAADAPLAPSVAPVGGTIGVMLASTPVHHLLAQFGRPLVMTSGNVNGEPVVIDDSTACEALGRMADLFLLHDRVIEARCDDSVVRLIAGTVRPVRRSRGYVPRSLALPAPVRAPILAVGGHMKNAVCIASGSHALLSAHIGDLDSAGSRNAMREAIAVTARHAGVLPTVVAHDLHPEYASTAMALAFGREREDTQRVAVQHHHAHVAAGAAEHGVRTPVIGVVFDGAGLGTDGAIWGGEFLVMHGARFMRCGHLAYVPLPGGDVAARRPWRSAAAHLASMQGSDAGTTTSRPAGIADNELQLVQRLLGHPERLPRTSSVGRLFDAVASLLGLCQVASFEGQAAMMLEEAAAGRTALAYPMPLAGDDPWTADPSTVIGAVLGDLGRGRDVRDIAAAFHATLAALVLHGCERVRAASGVDTVVLSGGVFCNALLAGAATDALTAARFRVLLPREVPCNDGGLSLGQAWIAACALEEDACA